MPDRSWEISGSCNAPRAGSVLIGGSPLRLGERVRVVEQQPPTDRTCPSCGASVSFTAAVFNADCCTQCGASLGPPEPTQGNEWDRATERAALDQARNTAHLPPGSSDAQALVDHGFAAGVEFACGATVDAVVGFVAGLHLPRAIPEQARYYAELIRERFKGAARDTGGRDDG